MLDNARKYKEEINKKLIDTWYDDKYKYYHVGNWYREYNPPEDDWERMCFVSLDKDKNVLGLILYSLDRNISSAYDFGAINFSDNKFVFGKDLYQVIDDIFFANLICKELNGMLFVEIRLRNLMIKWLLNMVEEL